MHMERRATDKKTTVWLPRRWHHAAKTYAAAHGLSVRAVLITALVAFLTTRSEDA
jgi:hypothetical protein